MPSRSYGDIIIRSDGNDGVSKCPPPTGEATNSLTPRESSATTPPFGDEEDSSMCEQSASQSFTPPSGSDKPVNKLNAEMTDDSESLVSLSGRSDSISFNNTNKPNYSVGVFPYNSFDRICPEPCASFYVPTGGSSASNVPELRTTIKHACSSCSAQKHKCQYVHNSATCLRCKAQERECLDGNPTLYFVGLKMKGVGNPESSKYVIIDSEDTHLSGE
ncbi:hypothetical protein M231_03782 [Tremella mesenterica]|uniref:Zn(2)-C6 fungal-type domain-containing protein n=1 Tax=Tremella mesenterica TaxID=5217 RepID=A0A4V1M430_TREME|nr:hypothetical protein M231_03782 [Tremella mesenterica]